MKEGRRRDEFFGSKTSALTFDDVHITSTEEFGVCMEPAYTDIALSDVSLETKFSRNIRLHIPIVSAAMDTVTEHRLAIAMAKSGGIGVIHRNFSSEKNGLTAYERQVKEVGRVKLFQHRGKIPRDKIVTASPDQTLGEVFDRLRSHDWHFNNLPVVTEENVYLGMLTRNHFIFYKDKMHEKVASVMTKSINALDVGTGIDAAIALMRKREQTVLPLVDAAHHLAGMYAYKDVSDIVAARQTEAIDFLGRLRIAAAIGTRPEDMKLLEMLVEKDVDAVVVDTAHGDAAFVIKMVHDIKKAYQSLDVVAGNICTADAAKRLVDAGADAIKVGMGPGSICTTRVVTGIGISQLTAIWCCAQVTEKAGIPLIADGGIRYGGDIAKALAAGADCVMVGSMLAGTDEAPGEIFHHDGKRWKAYRGMGSEGALREGGGSRYQNQEGSPLIPEGVEGKVPYKGPVKAILDQRIGELRKSMWYLGARTIPEIRDKARFWDESPSGGREGHPHDVEITKDAPNYSPPENF